MKRSAGADTTEAGEPDYSKMFLTLMHKLAQTKPQRADSMGSHPMMKGMMVGGESK